MDSRQTNTELAKYAQRQGSRVTDHGTFGMLSGAMVTRSNDGGVYYQGNHVKVVGDMIFKNGTYYGRAPRK